MIGIVFCNDLNTCPYIDKYIKLLDLYKHHYEIIIWDRSGTNKQYPNNYLVFREKSNIFISRWRKIGAFIRFKKFLIRTIKKQNYDKLIVLSTIPAVLCKNLLFKRYSKKYIFDFRDLSYERYSFFRRIVKKIIKKSYFTCISSPGFAKKLQLERNEYILAHNFRYSDLNNKFNNINISLNPIVLLHIGITRGETFNRKLVDIFGRDERFQVKIIGSGNDTDTFKEYIKDIPNIEVKGTYNNIDKMDYISNSSMLLYYYPEDYNCESALANKYYDGLLYLKPLIGNINTYSGIRVQEKNIGISLDINDRNFANIVYDYITNLDSNKYIEAVSKEIDEVIGEDTIYLNKIKEFIDE